MTVTASSETTRLTNKLLPEPAVSRVYHHLWQDQTAAYTTSKVK